MIKVGHCKCEEQFSRTYFFTMNHTLTLSTRSLALALFIIITLNFHLKYAVALEDNKIPLENENYHDEIDTHKQPIYLNEFAAYIPNGIEAAQKIAEKHGYELMGQVYLIN